MTATDFDILVVGYGPTGATFASLMAKRGYRVGVFDAATTIYDKPRAITADQEVMRIFQACGVADDIAPTTSPHPGTDFVGVEGQVIKQFYPAPAPHRLAWEPTWMFVQPELEALLRRGVERQTGVTTHLGYECLAYEQDAQRVVASFRRLSDDARVSVSARYLIGADGGRSTIRRAMDTPVEDLAFDEWWIVVDAWLRGPVALPARCVQYCRPSRPGTYIVGPGQLRRWEIKLLPGETPDDFQTEASVLAALGTFVDTTQLELCRTAIYRFHALVVEHWRDRRVFLMGDAAHQTPPFLGQGLCAGIRDTVNLAWKIDGVERLGYPDSLLDTYVEERKPHVRTVVAHAKTFGLIIGELDPEAARQRDRELGEALASGRAETVRQKFIPNLESGLIARDGDGSKARGAGELFVQPWIVTREGERRMDDLLPPDWALVTDTPEVWSWLSAQDAKDLARWNARRAVVQAHRADFAGSIVSGAVSDFSQQAHSGVHVLQDRDGLFARFLDELGARVVLVRPDRYVYGAAANAAELSALLAGLRKALASNEQPIDNPR